MYEDDGRIAVTVDLVFDVHAVGGSDDLRRAVGDRGSRGGWGNSGGRRVLCAAGVQKNDESGACAEAAVQESALRSTLPGFMMPRGSSACLMARMTSSSTGDA